MSNKEQKELAITIGLLVVFAVVLATSFKPKKRRHKTAKPKPATAVSTSSSLPPPPPPGAAAKKRPKVSSELLQKQQEREKLDWGRDPFFSSYSAVSLKEGNLSLKGISYSKDNPAALINTEVVFVGDKVGRAEVIDIKKNKVFLKEGERKFILRLEEK